MTEIWSWVLALVLVLVLGIGWPVVYWPLGSKQIYISLYSHVQYKISNGKERQSSFVPCVVKLGLGLPTTVNGRNMLPTLVPRSSGARPHDLWYGTGYMYRRSDRGPVLDISRMSCTKVPSPLNLARHAMQIFPTQISCATHTCQCNPPTLSYWSIYIFPWKLNTFGQNFHHAAADHCRNHTRVLPADQLIHAK